MRRALFALTLLVAASSASPAHAYNWMIRHGFAECGSCHIDPMGGETLNDMGRVMSQTLLSTNWAASPPTNAAMLLFGVLQPNNLYLGGSLRLMSLYGFDTGKTVAFPMQSDVYGAGILGRFTIAASLGVSKASRRYEYSSKAKLIGDVEDEGYLLVSRNYWVGYHLDDQDHWMLRLGRINLPFGLRVVEHTLWIRSETLTDRESDQQHGVSIVYTQGPWRGEFLASLGNYQIPNDGVRERGYSGYLELLVEPDLAIGVSSLVMVARRELEVDEGAVVRQAHGATLRYSPWLPLVFLAEADLLAKTGASVGYVGMAEVDYEPLPGLHVEAIGEILDRGEPPSGPGLGRGKPQLGNWLTLNWFFAPHFDLRVDLVTRQDYGEMLQTQFHFSL